MTATTAFYSKKNNIKSKSHRQQKVATLIIEAIVELLRKGKQVDIRLINCPVTITKVIVSSDLKLADCYFVPFNTSFSEQELIDSFATSKYAIRNFVTSKINLKYSPEIRFHHDQSFYNAQKVEQLLKADKRRE